MAVMDFGVLPPEVNSGLMYSGPGSGPMLTAAAAWDDLAAELGTAAHGYASLIEGLTSGPWQGPASVSMATAATPYVTWMTTTATRAGQAAGQAKAAAGAYHTAFALTVPPPLVTANRSLLTSLVATNFVGQNTPAIATTEAQYAEMWAQDAAAMYGYAGDSATASTVVPFTSPAPTTSPAAESGQAAATAQAAGTSAQTLTAVPSALQGLAAPMAASSAAASSTSVPSGLMNVLDTLTGNGSGSGFSAIFNDLFSSSGLGLNANLWNTIFSSGFYMPGNWLGTMMDFMGMANLTEAEDVLGAGEEAAAGADGLGGALGVSGLGGAAGGVGGVIANVGTPAAVSAGLGQAATIGGMSVPQALAPAADALGPAGGLLGSTPLATSPAVAAGMPMSPLSAMAGTSANGLHGGALPRYGFKPTVITRSPVG